jgi:hypothetical protein
MADELLAHAARRELDVLEKLYFEVFNPRASPSEPARAATGRRRR